MKPARSCHRAKSVRPISMTVQYIGTDPTSMCFANFEVNGEMENK